MLLFVYTLADIDGLGHVSLSHQSPHFQCETGNCVTLHSVHSSAITNVANPDLFAILNCEWRVEFTVIVTTDSMRLFI